MPNAREYALHCFSRSLNEQTFLTIEADCPDSPFVHMLTTTAFRRLTDIRQILSHLLHKPYHHRVSPLDRHPADFVALAA